MDQTPRKRQPWRASSDEDRLLAAYSDRRRPDASIYADIKLGGKGKRSHWKASKQHRLDAILARPSSVPGVSRRQAFVDRLRDGPPIEDVELIEANVGVSEEVIGQAVAGLCLWQGQYGIAVERTLVVACTIDPALRWVCERLGLDVVLEPIELKKRASKLSSRRPYTLDAARLSLIDPWRRTAGGTFVTRVPLGGPDSDVQAWEGADEVFLNLLRIPEGPVDALVLYDTPDRLLDLVADRPVDVIEVRRELKRGSIGKVLAHALMLEAQYEIPVGRRVIVCEKGDQALEWVCVRLGIDVQKV